MSIHDILRLFTGIGLILLTAVLVGCLNDRDSPQACRYSVRQDLDSGRWQQALSRLDSRACKRSMSEDEWHLNRSAAYIGLAGYELVDLVKLILSEPLPDEDEPDLRFIRALGRMGASPGALRNLEISLAEHKQMVAELQDGQTTPLQQACQPAFRDQLSPHQKDACFQAGLFAHARFAKAMVLLLEADLPAWLGDETLSCDNDLNDTGVADAAEITACALTARNQLGNGSGRCHPGSTTTGQVHWQTLPDYPELVFHDGERALNPVIPIRITVEPGLACPGRAAREGYRLLKPSPEPSLAVTEGFCRLDIDQVCGQASPSEACWPCIVPRPGSPLVMTVSNTLLDPINQDAELMTFLLPDVERERVASQLELTRQRLCEPAAGTGDSCDQREDGATRVRQSALRAYLER